MTTKPLQMKPLLSAEQMQQRVREIGAEISQRFAGESVILVGILKGSFIFLADLARAITVPTRIEFMSVSSYEGTQSTGHVRITQDLSTDIQDKNVIIVEDIVDTGTTVEYLLHTLQVRNPKALQICSLLSKREVHRMSHVIDYVGFEIGNQFVVGYGLDLDGGYRNLPDLMQVTSF